MSLPSTFCWFLQFCFFLDFVASTSEWAHHTTLDGGGRYHLYWTPPEDKSSHSEIIFKVEVEAKGFVGFGLSPNGGMTGSDIVTGWIRNGRPYFQDRHGIGKTKPVVDKKQDWKLLEARENETHTILQFKRKLDTCDEDDMVIDDSTIRVIYAFADKNPRKQPPFYHSRNRGTKSLMLLQVRSKKRPNLDDASMMHWEMRSPNFDISEYKSIYWCKIFKSPPLTKKHHIVYVKPVIQEGHEQFMHHMVLYECVGGSPDEYEEFLDFRGHQCHHPNMPDAMRRCEGITLAWALGTEEIIMPEHVGMPLDPEPGKYYMLEFHYDNPQQVQGIVDQSGLRIYYTPNLRKYDAGCLMLGAMVSPTVIVPPGQKEYVVAGHTNPECLGPGIPDDGIKVLGTALHSHLLSRHMRVRHFRGQKELPFLAVDKYYDFNYQEYRYYKEEVVFLPDDQITVECTYDSRKKNEVTFGGLTTDEEMCLAFLLYYPRIERYASLSVAPLSTLNEALGTSFTDWMSVYSLVNFNWTSVDVREVETKLRFSEHRNFCILGSGARDHQIESLISYPDNLEPFIPEDSMCTETRKN